MVGLLTVVVLFVADSVPDPVREARKDGEGGPEA